MNTDIRFTNFNFDKRKYYFLFISELKAYGIGYFFKEAISKIYKLDMDSIECITIAPDIFEQYNYNNLIIINKNKSRENKRKKHNDFIKDVSNSNYIDKLIDKLLVNQNGVFIYMFETSPYMTLDKKNGVTLVGPNKDIVSKLNNKIELYEIFSTLVPMASYDIANGIQDLSVKSEQMLQYNNEKVFVSLEKSAAGANSIIATHIGEIKEKFKENTDDTFLITKFIPHISDPTSLGVVINENEIFVAGIADQKINGTKFRGSTFPTKISKNTQEEIIRQTRIVGKKMAELGYRGIFGCDFIVTDKDEIFFIETNPRKQGTTMEFCCTLRELLPKNSPNLPEIEFYAVTQNKKAPNLKEIDFFNINLFWSTYNYKIENNLTTNSYIPQQNDEISMFDRIAKNKINKEFMIVEHIGQDFFVNKGSFLGRVISAGKNYKDVDAGIQIGTHLLNYTIKEYVDENFILNDNCYRCKYYTASIL
jgi:hypothetical protein